MHKALRQTDVLHLPRRRKQGGDLLVPEAGDSAAYPRHIEEELGVRLGIFDEFIDIGLDGLDTSLHGRYRIGLAPVPDAAAHHGAEIPECEPGRAAAVHAFQVAAEDKDLIGLELGYPFRGVVGTGDVVVGSHCFITCPFMSDNDYSDMGRKDELFVIVYIKLNNNSLIITICYCHVVIANYDQQTILLSKTGDNT